MIAECEQDSTIGRIGRQNGQLLELLSVQVCWNYMCLATIFKVIWSCLIFGISHYGNIHVFVHGIIACWNILRC
jgi:hypothetical protein